MKLLKKLKSSNFWVSMISAVVLILQAVFNVEIKAEYLSQIIMAMLGFLVMSGIVTDTNSGEVTIKQDLDIGEIKEKMDNMFTQSSALLQTNLDGIIKIFESFTQTINLSPQISSTQSVEVADITQTSVESTEDVNVETAEDNTTLVTDKKTEETNLNQTQKVATVKVQKLNVI